MLTLEQLQNLNNNTEFLILNKEFTNAQIKQNLKLAKVTVLSLRSASIAILTFSTNPQPISLKQVTPSLFSSLFLAQPLVCFSLNKQQIVLKCHQ